MFTDYRTRCASIFRAAWHRRAQVAAVQQNVSANSSRAQCGDLPYIHAHGLARRVERLESSVLAMLETQLFMCMH